MSRDWHFQRPFQAGIYIERRLIYLENKCAQSSAPGALLDLPKNDRQLRPGVSATEVELPSGEIPKLRRGPRLCRVAVTERRPNWKASFARKGVELNSDN